MIITPVTGQTGGSYGFIFDGLFAAPGAGEADQGVAFPAFHRLMKHLQRKPRLAMIKPGSRLKGIEPMAFLTITCQLPLVIILVTGGTFIGNRPVKHCFTHFGGKALRFLDVAFLTCSGPVLSLQRVVGIPLVVEFQELPLKTRGGMADLTSLIELVQVNVLVAIGTTGFQGFIDDGFAGSPGIVALAAGYGVVFPGEGIPPGIVVI